VGEPPLAGVRETASRRIPDPRRRVWRRTASDTDIEWRQLVALDASLTDVIHVLTQSDCCFVQLDGAVVGVIGRGDIEKPVVRMWLFGIIILIEVQVVELIRGEWPDGSWVALLSEGRLEKARQLRDERIRRELPADLLDCLQLSDKLKIAMQNQAFMAASGFGSAAAAKKVVKDLEASATTWPTGRKSPARLAANRPSCTANSADVRRAGARPPGRNERTQSLRGVR